MKTIKYIPAKYRSYPSNEQVNVLVIGFSERGNLAEGFGPVAIIRKADGTVTDVDVDRITLLDDPRI